MKVLIDNAHRNMPDFFIVGAGKSGTTSLHNYLSDHAEIFMPEIKETWFFQLVSNPNKEILTRLPYLPTTFPEYLKLYDSAIEEQICGDVTPSYLHFPQYAIPNILKFHPQAERLKIVAILREPISKILSQYRFQLKLGMERLPINQALAPATEAKRIKNVKTSVGLQYVSSTRYAESIKMYMDHFKDVRVYTYDELKNDKLNLMADLFGFLGVKPHIPSSIDKKFNTTDDNKLQVKGIKGEIKKMIYQYPVLAGLFPEKYQKIARKSFYHIISENDLSPKTKTYLKSTFKKEVSDLQSLTGKDLSHWLAKYE